MAGDDCRCTLFDAPRLMGDGRYRLIDGEWVPLDGENSPDLTPRAEGLQIIKDIEPYVAVASDKVRSRDNPIIGSRRRHREFLRDNGYIEVGNSFVPNRREELSKSDRVADIRRAMGDNG